MEWYHVYFITRLDNIIIASMVLMLVSGVAGTITLGVRSDIGDWNEKGEKSRATMAKWAKRLFAMCAVCATLCVITPSTKEAVAIWIVPKITHSDFAKEASKIPADAMKLLDAKLQEWMQDSKEKTTGVKHK